VLEPLRGRGARAADRGVCAQLMTSTRRYQFDKPFPATSRNQMEGLRRNNPDALRAAVLLENGLGARPRW